MQQHFIGRIKRVLTFSPIVHFLPLLSPKNLHPLKGFIHPVFFKPPDTVPVATLSPWIPHWGCCTGSKLGWISPQSILFSEHSPPPQHLCPLTPHTILFSTWLHIALNCSPAHSDQSLPPSSPPTPTSQYAGFSTFSKSSFSLAIFCHCVKSPFFVSLPIYPKLPEASHHPPICPVLLPLPSGCTLAWSGQLFLLWHLGSWAPELRWRKSQPTQIGATTKSSAASAGCWAAWKPFLTSPSANSPLPQSSFSKDLSPLKLCWENRGRQVGAPSSSHIHTSAPTGKISSPHSSLSLPPSVLEAMGSPYLGKGKPSQMFCSLGTTLASPDPPSLLCLLSLSHPVFLLNIQTCSLSTMLRFFSFPKSMEKYEHSGHSPTWLQTCVKDMSDLIVKSMVTFAAHLTWPCWSCDTPDLLLLLFLSLLWIVTSGLTLFSPALAVAPISILSRLRFSRLVLSCGWAFRHWPWALGWNSGSSREQLRALAISTRLLSLSLSHDLSPPPRAAFSNLCIFSAFLSFFLFASPAELLSIF